MNLQGDPVLHKEADLDVHQVQVFLHLLVGSDLGDHFLPQTRHVLFLLQVKAALLQQVDELAHHGERRVLGSSCEGADAHEGVTTPGGDNMQGEATWGRGGRADSLSVL